MLIVRSRAVARQKLDRDAAFGQHRNQRVLRLRIGDDGRGRAPVLQLEEDVLPFNLCLRDLARRATREQFGVANRFDLADGSDRPPEEPGPSDDAEEGDQDDRQSVASTRARLT